LVRLLQKSESVADANVGARVVEAPLVQLGKVFATSTDDYGVELHHHDLLDSRVAQHFPKSETIAASFDQDTTGVWMVEKRSDAEGLVIHELVVGKDLNQAVQEESNPVTGNASYDDFLIVGSLTKYPLLDA
jgi:hypothetical protein